MAIIKRIWVNQEPTQKRQWSELLEQANLSSDLHLDYIIGVYDEETQALLATGGFDGNIIQGIAIAKEAQSNQLLNTVITELMQEMQYRGIQKTFVYTKPRNTKFFKALGFAELVSTDEVVFLETGLPSFETYIQQINKGQSTSNNSAIVMNANPFTKGHQFLVDYAAEHSDHVYVFVLSEDRSTFSTKDRMAMVKLGTSHLSNVTVVPTGDYMVSQATFPTYFLKDKGILEAEKVKIQAEIDAKLFKERIAPALGITIRYVGEEPFSELTDIYNEMMELTFKEALQLKIIPRHTIGNDIISATKVRKAIEIHDFETASKYLPNTSINYLKGINKIP
ncbi:[citrate (pro-3S)-lyase] ligase [Fundicoccus culcitae]|uniref:[Citrate [pro-3S]-lyase] ligase n=1 Tax=Fundicoccus culcitae TaxID=2969821 RepID=A0ABY5P3N4_9LACT|nr:[citrate (pro-3S)-lyase] ligase [Fundicoccus culcitae]UUX33205.1 [citrate (pro-3S)-lyase] ligase [Fundicoccus culcitae]